MYSLLPCQLMLSFSCSVLLLLLYGRWGRAICLVNVACLHVVGILKNLCVLLHKTPWPSVKLVSDVASEHYLNPLTVNSTMLLLLLLLYIIGLTEKYEHLIMCRLNMALLLTITFVIFLFYYQSVVGGKCYRGTSCRTTKSIVVDWPVCDVTEQLLRNTQYRGFPVVVSQELRFLVGYVSRRDLTVAIGLSFCLICSIIMGN